MNESPNQNGMLITAWAAILILGVFKIVAQEIFHYSISESLYYTVMGLVVVAGFGLTWLWKPVRLLRPFFGLFIVLVGAQWLVYTRVDQLPVYKAWMSNPSFTYLCWLGSKPCT